ncbi:hypothetical protein ONZ45_g18423 [Pleurotus djamor]|nr:hypothetical protein ONZ45_g18423 [Pleurotus djamor]
MSVSLPREIIDIIIAFVARPPDLRECALVHRTWTPTCQRQLFRNITVSIEGSDSLASTYIGRLWSVLQKLPHLARCVEELSVGYVFGDAETARQEQQLLSIIIPTFTHLVKLSLCCDSNIFLFDFDILLVAALREVLSSPRLRHVTIDGWYFNDLPHFISLMGTHVNDALSTLTLGYIEFYNSTPLIIRPKTGPPNTLDSLVVEMDNEDAETWFASLTHPLAAKSLKLGDELVEAAMPLVTRFSAGLEKLTINFPGNDSLEEVDVDFGNLSRLSKFTLNLHPDFVLYSLLHSLPDQIEALEFRDGTQWCEEWATDAVTFVDEFLVKSEKFAHLKTLTFNCRRDPGLPLNPLQFFQRNLEESVKKGIVHLNLEMGEGRWEVFNSSDIRNCVILPANPPWHTETVYKDEDGDIPDDEDDT